MLQPLQEGLDIVEAIESKKTTRAGEFRLAKSCKSGPIEVLSFGTTSPSGREQSLHVPHLARRGELLPPHFIENRQAAQSR